MEFPALGYTPGWPLMLVFPQLFFEAFNEGRSAAVMVVFVAALLGLLHDSAVGKAPSPGRRFLALGLLLWLPLIPALDPLIPSEVLIEGVPTKLLIEPPQILLNVALLALLFRMTGRDDGGSGRYWLAGGAGLVLAAGYFTKSAMVMFVPMVAVFLAHHVTAHVTADMGSAQAAGVGKRARGVRNGLTMAALVFGPFAVMFVLWLGVTPDSSNCRADPLAFIGSLLGADRQAVSFARFAEESLAFFSSLSSPASGALLILALLALFFGRFRPMAMTAIAWAPKPGNPHAKVATSRELLADIPGRRHGLAAPPRWVDGKRHPPGDRGSPLPGQPQGFHPGQADPAKRRPRPLRMRFQRLHRDSGVKYSRAPGGAMGKRP